MVRLIAPNGAKVDVADVKVAWLKGQGFTDADDQAKEGRKATAARSTRAKRSPAPDQK